MFIYNMIHTSSMLIATSWDKSNWLNPELSSLNPSWRMIHDPSQIESVCIFRACFNLEGDRFWLFWCGRGFGLKSWKYVDYYVYWKSPNVGVFSLINSTQLTASLPLGKLFRLKSAIALLPRCIIWYIYIIHKLWYVYIWLYHHLS